MIGVLKNEPVGEMSDEQTGSDQPSEAAIALRGDADHGDGGKSLAQ
jgi:hypothetical protein